MLLMDFNWVCTGTKLNIALRENKMAIFHDQTMIEKFQSHPNLVNNHIMMLLCFGNDNYWI